MSDLKMKKSNKSASANLSDPISAPLMPPEGFDDVSFCPDTSVCSAGDCTGLMPTLPDSDAELEAYEEMYQFCLKEKNQDF